MNAARADVWPYLADPERRAEWWAELQLEPGIGGTVAERWSEGDGEESVSRDASGTVDVWVEGHAIGFTWREAGDERDTAVLITLRTQGYQTGLTVTETGFDALPAASERAAASQEGWRVLLRDLVAAIDAAGAAGRLAHTVVAGVGVAAADPSGAAGTELVVAPEEVDGEVDDAAAPEDAASGTEVDVEVDPEPELGERLELDTGSVEVVDAGEAEPGTGPADPGSEPSGEQSAAAAGVAAEPDADADAGAGSESGPGGDLDGAAESGLDDAADADADADADAAAVDEESADVVDAESDDAAESDEAAESDGTAESDDTAESDAGIGADAEAGADAETGAEAEAEAETDAPADPIAEADPATGADPATDADDTIAISREAIDDAMHDLGLGAEDDAPGEPEEPDFDTLIRGS
ncbi:SRPBCC domain-containing protein [Leucobacter allii]|uniref:SRPBCC domain-containing protein n=1 Tax=Leucobacter allii TaxID=2932247 RepID=A0ABY4FJZ0_9MICO|nr:SRPBCC domain-containing protein [Leucobacter allii]UOQ56508.1 SRPBCC domain-containing protein [Leucobacter allii]